MATSSELLRQFGIRPSPQRAIVLDFLLNHHEQHQTAEEIFNALHEEIPDMAKITVVNTLQLFLSSGLIKAINIGRLPAVYDTIHKHHAHFFCSSCHAMTDVPIEETDWEKMLCYSNNPNVEMQITFTGICQQCNQIHPSKKNNQ